MTFYGGIDAKRAHNMYSVIYNKLVFEILEKRFGKHEAVVFARASAAGGQRYPVVRSIFTKRIGYLIKPN